VIRQKFRLLGILLGILVVAGCAANKQSLRPDATPQLTEGYVGVAAYGQGAFAIVLTDEKTGVQHSVPLEKGSAGASTRFTVYSLPPGTYRISEWFRYDAALQVRVGGKSVDGTPLASPFPVAPGKLTVIGQFVVNVDNQVAGYQMTRETFGIRPVPVGDADVQAWVERSYPKFSSLPFVCVYCR
jgi:hypothetical protein